MERKRKQKVLFRKIGGGSFRTKKGKIIKPNETFLAYPEDIPDAFKDTIIPVEEPPEVEPEPDETDAEEYYLIEERENAPGWFDVVNADGKAINETALREKDAKELLKRLIGEEEE